MGDRLKRQRKAAGMSQPQVTAVERVPVSTLRRWEHGRRLPRVEAFIAVADGLGVSLDGLAGRVSARSGRGREYEP